MRLNLNVIRQFVRTHMVDTNNNRLSDIGSPSSSCVVRNCDLLTKVKTVIPQLDASLHKGECGRICVFGGCNLYTGAPYFAAISALKTGADIVHIMCEQSAGSVIKGYSPELIVHPVLDTEYALEEIDRWLPRFHSVVIGPGLGRDQSMLGRIAIIIERVKRTGVPLIIDADGLWHIIHSPSLIVNSKQTVITPNAMEFCRLAKAILQRSSIEPCSRPDPDVVADVAKRLGGGVTIVHKGAADIISDGKTTESCFEDASPRRCGGQGDVLSGACAVFMHWATSARLTSKRAGSSAAATTASNGKSLADSDLSIQKADVDASPAILAAWAACRLTRRAAGEAYVLHGRSSTTTDVISQIGPSFRRLFDGHETNIL